MARAQLEANRARLRSAEIELGYTRISAPIDGVVAEVSTREGETVAAAFAAPNFVTIIDIDRLEERMEPEIAEQLYELERCIECGCCVAACGTAQMREDFIGAVGLNQIARFRLDPRDGRSDAEFYRLVGDESGVFGCMTLLGCEDMCPKDLPLAAQIAFLRRRMVVAGLR